MTSAQRQLAGMVSNIQAMVDASEYEIAVWPGMLFNPSTTAIDIYPNDPFRDADTASFSDSGGYRWIVRARTGLNDLDAGQQILLDLMDDDSDNCLKLALEDDETLGGYATQVSVDEPSGFAPFRAPGEDGTMVGFTLEVLVMAAHS